MNLVQSHKVFWGGVWMCRGLPEVGDMHFYFIFQMFAFQSIHSSHFLLHFSHSDHSSAKQPKMKLKMSQKWPKNANHEQPYCCLYYGMLNAHLLYLQYSKCSNSAFIGYYSWYIYIEYSMVSMCWKDHAGNVQQEDEQLSNVWLILDKFFVPPISLACHGLWCWTRASNNPSTNAVACQNPLGVAALL
jgi:hypothetical protein